jgi:hypothetical protein
MKSQYIVAILGLFILCAPACLRAQESKLSGLSFSVSGGLAIPVGAYKSTNPESSVVTGEIGFPRFNGFNKKGNAAALQGYTWNAEVKYTLPSNWAFSFAVTSTFNPVETEEIDAYLNEQLGRQGLFTYQVNQRDYQVMFYSLGVSKFKHWKNFFAGGGVDLGLGIMNYPLYDVSIISTSSGFNYPFYHIGYTPNSKSFALGIKGETGYKLSSHFSASLLVNYRTADFLYDIGLQPVGGSAAYLFIDKVNYRQLLPSLKVCYQF